jgi:mannose-6-phosphate isomerase-like protein (cupin superfamily)
MKNIIKKEERITQKNSEKCTAYEYPFHDKDLDITYVEINGRYPDEGLVTNEKVKESFLVLSGSGKLFIDQKESILKEGDAIFILPKQKYFWEGNFKLVISSNPAWSPEQHKNIKLK